MCSQAIEYALSARSSNDSFVEWGGGYYFPDRFGVARTHRWELLARQARRTWAVMQKTGSRIISFNVSQFDSPDAHKAYEVVAGQTDGLLAILVFQYSPYEAGMGRIFWVRDRKGVELPVITARYSIWEHQNSRPRSGTPAKVAREIRQTVETTPPEHLPRYDWVIAHAWSYFKQAPGASKVLRTCRKRTPQPKVECAAIPRSPGALPASNPASASSARKKWSGASACSTILCRPKP